MPEYEVHWLNQGTDKTVCGIATVKTVFTWNRKQITCKYCRIAVTIHHEFPAYNPLGLS